MSEGRLVWFSGHLGTDAELLTVAEVLAEMGGERMDRCAICKDTPRKAPKGDPCGNCGAMTVERVWVVKGAGHS